MKKNEKKKKKKRCVSGDRGVGKIDWTFVQATVCKSYTIHHLLYIQIALHI